MMFDTHCHLNFDVFEEDLESVVKKSKEKGVENILVPGTDLLTSKKAVEIAERFAGVYSALGVHPTEDLENIDLEKTLTQFEELIEESKKIVAVGEVGLDYYRFKAGTSTQIEFLERQINFAKKMGLSLVLHNRHAAKDLLSLLESVWDETLCERTVFHCSEPSQKILDFAKKKNVFLGINGDISYDEKKQAFLKEVPLERLVLETDSPFLTPVPLRKDGKRNEPANLVVIADFISSLLKIDKSELLKQTGINAKKLFNL